MKPQHPLPEWWWIGALLMLVSASLVTLGLWSAWILLLALA